VTPINFSVFLALIAEFVGTFALAYVVLNAATAKGTAGNSFLRIGDWIHGHDHGVRLGPISGGAFNPTVATGIPDCARAGRRAAFHSYPATRGETRSARSPSQKRAGLSIAASSVPPACRCAAAAVFGERGSFVAGGPVEQVNAAQIAFNE